MVFTENKHRDNVQQPLVFFIGECYLLDRSMPSKSLLVLITVTCHSKFLDL